ncbi:MAG TPA: ATP-binding protein [Methylibium sp.]|uniref:sensor histidine kinase n=1 Tax=Methylibium sp. TaxID=2067992 RepID=UPI002DBEA242|nr:ATP-binding protein [Methylibium sp.]HEU4458003.1 ATP-binding protein [Methylibium sp.]
MQPAAAPSRPVGLRTWPAWVAWAVGWAAMFVLDGSVDLANLALVLMLSSAVASLWWQGWAAAVAGGAAVLAFNWSFVPPRHTLGVDLRQHALLLIAMLVVNGIVSALVIRQRALARAAQESAQREQRLRQWGDALRDAADPVTHASALRDLLAYVAPGAPVAVLVAPHGDAAAEPAVVGNPDANQRAGLDLCLRENRALGPGSGRFEEQRDVYLPLRGRGLAFGAALLPDIDPAVDRVDLAHAQALCDQMGQALQRAATSHREREAREQAHEQGVRNALLAAVSHDYRTPLATIMSAASSLEQQSDRLGTEQRRRLATTIVEEAGRLARLTDNTLQLARLDAPGVRLRCDWESAEEIVGSAMRRARRRKDGERVYPRVEPGLPLLWCDAILVSQLLDNLIDNALKYSPPDTPVEVAVCRDDGDLRLAVRDRGPGITPAWREKVFEVFRRGEATPVSEEAPGAGVGLAVCRAIAGAHGGTLAVRSRGRGGASFDCRLPLREAPAAPLEEPVP